MRHITTTLTTTALMLFVVLLSSNNINVINAQENIQLQIPPSLVECYNTSFFINRENRLPATIETLISLIEKVENSPDYNLDIRTLAVGLLQRFRQDGIQRAPGVVAAPGVIPYSPTGFQFPKFRILLSRLIPGNAFNFPNSSLSRQERCSLHFMLSSSFNTQVRGDEGQVCSQLSQYRAQRLPRMSPIRFNMDEDVEVLENLDSKYRPRAAASAPAPQMGKQVNWNAKSSDYDYGWSEVDTSSNSNSVSQCPVENGVVWTPWGTVAAGTLIAGIAAGLQQQTVQLRTLLALSRRPGGPSQQQTATVNVDNRWAATLAGDLAEVALVQVPYTSTHTASVGANGAWNSTVLPKWYFLTQRQNKEMTDAEIRGGLDGLILAKNVVNWRTQASNLKLSQLLRMYYSLDGVLGTNFKACNRKEQFATIAPLSEMIPQTSAFAQVLDREMQLTVTLSPANIANFSQSASNALLQYVPQYLNDVSCSVSSALPQDTAAAITPMTNIYVFLDTSWQYLNVVDYVAYILQRININPYASTVTLLAASDGSVIVNTTNYLTEVYEKWNVTTHSWYTPGFNLPSVLRTLQNQTQYLLNAQQTNSSVGGLSLIALLIPNTATVNDGDSSYSTQQLQYLSEQMPDLRYIYYTGGSINRFASFVQDPSQDLFALTLGTNNVAASSGPVVRRIKQIPRRIINPRCGASWYSSSTGSNSIAQYARPGVINFYRVVPNYFYGAGSSRTVSVQSQNSFQFVVCSSRSVNLPMQNSSTAESADQSCTNVNSNTYSYDLSNACNGYTTIHQCPPLYLSVQALNSTYQTVSCTDAACQTPDQLKYTINVQNLGCYSGVAGLLASLSTILLAYFLRDFLQ